MKRAPDAGSKERWTRRNICQTAYTFSRAAAQVLRSRVIKELRLLLDRSTAPAGDAPRLGPGPLQRSRGGPSRGQPEGLSDPRIISAAPASGENLPQGIGRAPPPLRRMRPRTPAYPGSPRRRPHCPRPSSPARELGLPTPRPGSRHRRSSAARHHHPVLATGGPQRRDTTTRFCWMFQAMLVVWLMLILSDVVSPTGRTAINR
jgi:hypothetical protein